MIQAFKPYRNSPTRAAWYTRASPPSRTADTVRLRIGREDRLEAHRAADVDDAHGQAGGRGAQLAEVVEAPIAVEPRRPERVVEEARLPQARAERSRDELVEDETGKRTVTDHFRMVDVRHEPDHVPHALGRERADDRHQLVLEPG